MLKEVRPQEVNSLVQTNSKNDGPASGNRLRECIHNFETLENEIQFTRICENATFLHRVSVGMCYKTGADVDDGLEIGLQHAESLHTTVRTPIPESMLPFRNEK